MFMKRKHKNTHTAVGSDVELATAGVDLVTREGADFQPITCVSAIQNAIAAVQNVAEKRQITYFILSSRVQRKWKKVRLRSGYVPFFVSHF
jgi:hypothetical protein